MREKLDELFKSFDNIERGNRGKIQKRMKIEKVITHELDQIASTDIASNIIDHPSKKRKVCAHECLGDQRHIINPYFTS